jgi:hypothetical protein
MGLATVARGKTKRPLWKCPECGQSFVTRNMWHSCVRLTEADFFRDRPRQKELYGAFLRLVRELGPVTINVTKSRISFQARVRFAGVARIVRDGIVCGFWLKRRVESPRFSKVERIPPRDYIYQFKLTDEAQLDAEVRGWLAEAYRVGQQVE